MNHSEVLVAGVSDVSAGAAHARGPSAAGRGAKSAPSSAALLGRPGRLTVQFSGGHSGVLDTSEARGRVWADVLLSLRETGQPAYVELEPQTRVITQLLLPVEVAVEAIRPAVQADGVEVDLRISHARHYVRRQNPNYDALVKALERARREKSTVLVTESLDGHEIIDVRPAGGRKPLGR